jgi:hypothetical protein
VPAGAAGQVVVGHAMVLSETVKAYITGSASPTSEKVRQILVQTPHSVQRSRSTRGAA